jgi:hypothetical protein
MPAHRSVFRNSALLSRLVTPDQLEQAVLTAGVTIDGAEPAGPPRPSWTIRSSPIG